MKEIAVDLCGNRVVTVTENADGKLYLIKAEHIQAILDDWNGECSFVPANDARVFFAALNGKPLNPYSYSDFESFLALITGNDIMSEKCFPE